MSTTGRRSRLRVLLPFVAWSLIGAAGGWSAAPPSGPSFVLRGTLVTPDQVIRNGQLLVSGERIADLGPGVSAAAGVQAVDVDGVVFPGLIDLHDHILWNLLPRWKAPEPSADRYVWQELPDYVAHLAGPQGRLVASGYGCDMNRYGEYKAIVGGATSVVGSFAPTADEPHRNDCIKGLARNLDFYSGLYGSLVNEEPVRYVVFPLETPVAQANSLREGLASHHITTVLVHLAEGRDASARREFAMLKAQDLLRPGVSIIHGVALHEDHFREMAANGVGLIWSPRSNYELYGETTNVAQAKAAGVTLALAPDWSPTGSNGMLDELNYAYEWSSRTKVFAPAELVKMATTHPARLAAISDRLGSLTKGLYADLLVVRDQGSSPYEALLLARPQDVRLVVIDGHPIYGDTALMRRLVADAKQLEPISVCGEAKAFDAGSLGAASEGSLANTSARLAAALGRLDIPLAPLFECR
jgi:5-methylthioadenosine/S-adenosylhomocysteine deaminase